MYVCSVYGVHMYEYVLYIHVVCRDFPTGSVCWGALIRENEDEYRSLIDVVDPHIPDN